MVILGFLWLALLVVEFTWGLLPVLQPLGTAIWVVFIADFFLRLLLAPRRGLYLRRNWLTIIALLLPALRVFRLARALRLLRFGRSVYLVRVLTSLNRGMRSLGKTMERRGALYAALLTVVVVVVSAAGMYAFESRPQGEGLNSYFEALWWTAMLVSTMGSGYWPLTLEGRVLALLLSIYSVGVFGYVAASLASFFVGQDREADPEPDEHKEALEALIEEVAALRRELAKEKRGDG